MKRGIVGAGCVLVVALVFAASAAANTYCVPSGGAGCTNAGALDLQSALTSAAAISGPDTVRVAAGTFQPTNCSIAGFTYNSPDPLTLTGTGFSTLLTCPDNYNTASFNYILDLTGPVTVSDLNVHIPKGFDGRGVSLAGGVAASDLTVTSDLAAGNVIGVKMAGGSLTDSLIGTPLSDNFEGVFATAGASLRNVSVTSGGTGVSAEGSPDVTIVHSKISARRGVVTDSFGVTVTDTMIDVLPGSGFGTAAGLLTSNNSGAMPLTITARHVSIVGSAPGSIGVDVEALVAGQTASATVTDTVIHGPPIALKRSAVALAGATANLTTSYDAYAAGNYPGTGAGATTQVTPPVTGDPGFDAPADPHVSASSPLIDAGSPGGLTAGEPTVDLDGNPRILDGNHDCVARRDIGAYEFINSPTVHVSASSSTARPGQTVMFHATGCSIDPASSVTFSWQFDDGGTATGATVSHAFAHAGVHRATVTIRDAANRISATSVSVTVQAPASAPRLSRLKLGPSRFHVVRKRHKHFKLGTTISYTDSLAATTTFTVTQKARGVVKGKKCVAPPRHPAKHAKKPKRCARTITLGTFTHRDKAGPGSVKWAGTLKRHALKPGTYTLSAVAKAGGRKSRAVSARFTVLG